MRAPSCLQVEDVRRSSALALRSLKQQLDQLHLRYKDTAEALQKHSASMQGGRHSSSSALHSPPVGATATAAHGSVASDRSSSGGRAVVVKLAEAEAKVDQLTRALAKKGAYMDQRLRQEKDRSAKQLAALKAQLSVRGSGETRCIQAYCGCALKLVSFRPCLANGIPHVGPYRRVGGSCAGLSATAATGRPTTTPTRTTRRTAAAAAAAAAVVVVALAVAVLAVAV